MLKATGAIVAVALTATANAHAQSLPVSVEVMRVEEPILSRPDRASPKRGAAHRGARLPVYGTSAGPGCQGSWFAVGPVAWICEEGAAPSALPPSSPRPEPEPSGLPYEYRFVGPDGSFGYRVLETAEEGVPDEQLLPGFAVALARVAPKPPQGDQFGLTTHRMWVPLRDLGPAVAAPRPLGYEHQGPGIAWVLTRDAPLWKSPGGARLGKKTLPRLSIVLVGERLEKSGETWLRVEGDGWLRGRDATWAVTRPPPPEAEPNERWVDVDLARQVVTAYRGTEPQFSLLASTGRGPAGTELATPSGVHRLWIKLESSDMDNLEATDASRNYAIQAVPWVMYFDHGYGLHGAFWHDEFGHVHSHGCVNLAPADAERLFAWTSPRLPGGWSAVFPTSYERGTLVRVE